MKCILCKEKEITKIRDVNNPFTKFYKCEDCGTLIMEPVFKRKLELFLEMHPDGIGYNKIINKIKELIKNEKPIVFVDEVDTSFTEVENASYMEFRDVLDLCQIEVNDISRGSDYGDWSGPHFMD